MDNEVAIREASRMIRETMKNVINTMAQSDENLEKNIVTEQNKAYNEIGARVDTELASKGWFS